jgi:hypothetical protein
MLAEINPTSNHVAGCFFFSVLQKDKKGTKNVDPLEYVGPYGDPIFSAENENPSSPW